MFNFNRFVNVARWDLTVNSKFYTRAAILIVALTCSPVLLYYLHILASGLPMSVTRWYDNVFELGAFTSLIGFAITVVSSGYMFHNLLTKQGRINELTLPATNLERFLWHFVVIVVGVQVLWIGGVVLADMLHALFRLAVPYGETRSLTLSTFSASWWGNLDSMHFLTAILIVQLFACFVRSFALFNAWKYKYNIPWTMLFYFILQNVFTLLSLVVVFNVFDNPLEIERIWNWFNNGWHANTVLVCLNILAFLLYIGIWLLTYRLYTRAQLTTKRNP